MATQSSAKPYTHYRQKSHNLRSHRGTADPLLAAPLLSAATSLPSESGAGHERHPEQMRL